MFEPRSTLLTVSLFLLATACGGGGGDATVDPEASSPAPRITGCAPEQGFVEGDTWIEVTGTGFDGAPGATTVTIGGQPAADVTVQSSTKLTCRSPTGAAGPADVVVATAAGSDRLPGAFVYLAPYLYAALAFNDFRGMDSESRLEIVDLTTSATVGGFDLPGVGASSMAVSPDGRTVYLTDTAGGEVLAYTHEGVRIDAFAVEIPRDLVLSADGSRLYVSALDGIYALDTSTMAPVGLVTVEDQDVTFGIALSPDGDLLAAAAQGTSAAVQLLSTAPFAGLVRIPIQPTAGPGCAEFPTDVAFTDTDRILAWDSNCDRIYQIDVPTRTHLVAEDIAFGRDGAATYSENAIHYLPQSGRAYSFVEANRAAVSDPATASGELLDGFVGNVRGPAPRLDGTGVYYAVRDLSADTVTLDLLDVATQEWTRTVHTFGVTSRYPVADMRVVRIPGP